jgi:hypothetical protein
MFYLPTLLESHTFFVAPLTSVSAWTDSAVIVVVTDSLHSSVGRFSPTISPSHGHESVRSALTFRNVVIHTVLLCPVGRGPTLRLATRHPSPIIHRGRSLFRYIFICADPLTCKLVLASCQCNRWLRRGKCKLKTSKITILSLVSESTIYSLPLSLRVLSSEGKPLMTGYDSAGNSVNRVPLSEQVRKEKLYTFRNLEWCDIT